MALLGLLVSGQAFGLHHNRVRHTPKHRGRRIVWNPLFRPSHESLIRQNQEVDRLDLPRIANDQELEQLVEWLGRVWGTNQDK